MNIFRKINFQKLKKSEQDLELIMFQAKGAEYVIRLKLRKTTFILRILSIVTYVFPIFITTVSLASETIFKECSLLKDNISILSLFGSMFILCLGLTIVYILDYENLKQKLVLSLRDNMRIYIEAKNMLKFGGGGDREWFFKFVNQQDQNDIDFFSSDNKKINQAAYRYAAKQLGKSNCVKCQSNLLDEPEIWIYSLFSNNQICSICGLNIIMKSEENDRQSN